MGICCEDKIQVWRLPCGQLKCYGVLCFLSLEDTCCAFSIQDDFRALILPWIE